MPDEIVLDEIDEMILDEVWAELGRRKAAEEAAAEAAKKTGSGS